MKQRKSMAEPLDPKGVLNLSHYHTVTKHPRQKTASACKTSSQQSVHINTSRSSSGNNFSAKVPASPPCSSFRHASIKKSFRRLLHPSCHLVSLLRVFVTTELLLLNSLRSLPHFPRSFPFDHLWQPSTQTDKKEHRRMPPRQPVFRLS